MARAYIRTGRTTKRGEKRYYVEWRRGGRESRLEWGGSFRTLREARIRCDYINGELAAQRVPDLRPGARTRVTVGEAGSRWLATRIDTAEATTVRHGVELKRIDRLLGSRPVEQLDAAEVAAYVAALAEEGYARSTIRKTLQTLAMVIDHAGVDPNPARDRSVRLPRGEEEEINPPTAEHVETVFRLLPSKHRLALLWLDWSGQRVGTVDSTLVSDYDEPRRRIRLRRSTTKTGRPQWYEPPNELADAIEATLGPREDRDPQARLFAGSGADALRTSIAKACRAAGIPLFSPHDLRHRRISLMHLRGVPWVRIGEFVGQRSISVTAETYSHVMVDETELNYAELLGR